MEILKDKMMANQGDSAEPTVLFIPPAYDCGSLGDEAMLIGSIQYLRAKQPI